MTNLLIFVKERENIIIKDQCVKQGEIPYIILNSLEKVLFFNYFPFSYSNDPFSFYNFNFSSNVYFLNISILELKR
jgi:hypothetical protein